MRVAAALAMMLVGCADPAPPFEFQLRVYGVPSDIDTALVDGVETSIVDTEFTHEIVVARMFVSYVDATAAAPIEVVFDADGTLVIARGAPGVCVDRCMGADCIRPHELERESISNRFGSFDVGYYESFHCTGAGKGFAGSP